MNRAAPLAALALTAALTLSACAGSSTESATSPSVSEPAPTATASQPAQVEPSARVGDCFDNKTYFSFTDVPAPVECKNGKYTEKTLAVYDLPETLALSFPERQEFSDKVKAGIELTPAQESTVTTFREQIASLYDDCRVDVKSAVGQQANRVSLFGIDLTGPNQEQWNNGERWARCNIIRALPADAKRKATRLLPLPFSLTNAADFYLNQFCEDGDGKKYRVALCNAPAFTDGAWLKVLGLLPFKDVGDYPGSSKKANNLVDQSCLTLTKPYVQTSANITSKNIYVAGTAPNWEGDSSPTWKDAWEDPDGVYRCYVPNWSYIGAPPN